VDKRDFQTFVKPLFTVFTKEDGALNFTQIMIFVEFIRKKYFSYEFLDRVCTHRDQFKGNLCKAEDQYTVERILRAKRMCSEKSLSECLEQKLMFILMSMIST